MMNPLSRRPSVRQREKSRNTGESLEDRQGVVSIRFLLDR
jgi:hypothetical protein